MKEKLVAVINEAKKLYVMDDEPDCDESEFIAEWLLYNGVKIPKILNGTPIYVFRLRSKNTDCFCDTVRFVKTCLRRGDAIYITVAQAKPYHNNCLGGTVFTTFNEAEAKLKSIMEEINAN